MKKFSSLVIVALSMHFQSTGQLVRRPVAAMYTSIGAYSNTHSDPLSCAANQAALARINSTSGVVYGERRFMLDELSHYKLALACPGRFGNFGVQMSYSGFALFNEMQAGLLYAKRLGTAIDIGVQFNYNGIKAASYGSAYAISAEAGIILHLTERLNAGIHMNNPAGGKYNKGGIEKLPFVYTAGLGYEASAAFFASIEIQKEEDEPVNVITGLQYRFLRQVFARAGVSSVSSTAWLGVGIGLQRLRLDVTASYHPQLGLTPGLLLAFEIGSKKTPEESNP